MIKNILIAGLTILFAITGWMIYSADGREQELRAKIAELEQTVKEQPVIEKVIIAHDSVRCAQ